MADTKTTATSTTTLPKEVFAVEVPNHDLLQRAYHAYLANSRENRAVTKTRGLVSGGGKKPWRQKGTGRARVGSSRTPVWRGGGVVFGPTGTENYTITIPTAQKRQAVRQALTLAHKSKKVSTAVFTTKEGKTKDAVAFLTKHKADRRVLIVVDRKDQLTERAFRNLRNSKVVQATYLNVFDILNADTILIAPKALPSITDWLTRPARGGTDA